MIHIRDLSSLRLVCIDVPIFPDFMLNVYNVLRDLGAVGQGTLDEMRCNSSEPQRFWFHDTVKFYHAYVYRTYPQISDTLLYVEPQRHASILAIKKHLAKEWIERGNPMTELTDEYQRAFMA